MKTLGTYNNGIASKTQYRFLGSPNQVTIFVMSAFADSLLYEYSEI